MSSDYSLFRALLYLLPLSKAFNCVGAQGLSITPYMCTERNDNRPALSEAVNDAEGHMSSERCYCLSMRSSSSPFADVKSGTGKLTSDGSSSCRSVS